MKEKDEDSGVDLSLVLGYIAIKDLQTTEKKVAVLTHLGFSNTAMAKICGTSATVIRSLKYRAKKGS
jgi:DNA-directed RNA polymerase specialized sigma24 family protein